MQPSVIQRAVVRRTIRASTTRHWLQTRQPIITQSQLRYLSTESASEHNSNGFNLEKREFVPFLNSHSLPCSLAFNYLSDFLLFIGSWVFNGDVSVYL